MGTFSTIPSPRVDLHNERRLHLSKGVEIYSAPHKKPDVQIEAVFEPYRPQPAKLLRVDGRENILDFGHEPTLIAPSTGPYRDRILLGLLIGSPGKNDDGKEHPTKHQRA